MSDSIDTVEVQPVRDFVSVIDYEKV
ncbi:uncharacterized protein FFB20_10998 [Fusarium fujikuroi]|nr:uncharacterized protein FFB20_10998 [Fusarium fujikuroi]SCO24309.1 uncharacterized protein FFE2_15921 [Fusarium fujikuroi]SCO25562.1 uncharacterized protein FFC1_15589 [Fusarium fujikuroi]SCO54000.1 uncharacterized protein FFNC_15282 [Fusarium fujikuroi]